MRWAKIILKTFAYYIVFVTIYIVVHVGMGRMGFDYSLSLIIFSSVFAAGGTIYGLFLFIHWFSTSGQ
jgi:hypothetical protein